MSGCVRAESQTLAHATTVACIASMLIALGGAVRVPAQRRAARIPTLPLAVTVAQDGRRPVVDRAWVDAQVSTANALFRPHGVTFRVTERHTMGSEHARLETRADRHALGALLHPRSIDWFVVASLRDVDEPERFRQGVHWRPRGSGFPPDAHFVVVSAIAGPTVLAHELGHYFGNGHSDVPGNVMSYEPGEGPPSFDSVQARRIRDAARRFLASDQLLAVGH